MQISNLYLSCPQVPRYLENGKRKDMGMWDAKNNIVFSQNGNFNEKPLPDPSEELEGVCFIVSQSGNTVIGDETHWDINNLIVCNGISWLRFMRFDRDEEALNEAIQNLINMENREHSRFPIDFNRDWKFPKE